MVRNSKEKVNSEGGGKVSGRGQRQGKSKDVLVVVVLLRDSGGTCRGVVRIYVWCCGRYLGFKRQHQGQGQ